MIIIQLKQNLFTTMKMVMLLKDFHTRITSTGYMERMTIFMMDIMMATKMGMMMEVGSITETEDIETGITVHGIITILTIMGITTFTIMVTEDHTTTIEGTDKMFT